MTVSNAPAGVRRRKPLIIAAAIVAAVLVGGGVTAAVLVTQHNAAVTAAEDAWETAANAYVTVIPAYKEELDLRDKAVSSAAVVDPKPLLDAVGEFASKESVGALNAAHDAVVAAYPEGAETASTSAVDVLNTVRPTGFDEMVADTTALITGKTDLEAATTALAAERADANKLADAFAAAILGVENSLAENAAAARTTYPNATPDVLGELSRVSVFLQGEVEENNVGMDTVRAVVTALTAVKASNDTNAATVQPQAESGSHNGATGATDGASTVSTGSDNSGSTSVTTDTTSPAQPEQPTPPKQPEQPTRPQPEPPSQPEPEQPTYAAPTTNVPAVSGGNCAVVGSATSTAGNHLNAPGGVTHYSLNGSGNSWTFTWYTCE